MKQNLFIKLCLLFVLVCFTALLSHACKIPVYRYALERWAPDLFEVIVFYDDQIPLELIDQLESGDADHGGAANYVLRDTSINDLNQPMDLIWESLEAESTPWVLVRNANAPIGEIVWHGPADDETVQYLIESPARTSVIESLAAGESAAWVLLTCGDAEKDDTARKLIASNLKKMEEMLQLPEQDPGVRADALKLKFSFTEVSRDDPKEEFFVTQLLQTEPDLIAYSDEPIAFPVYGRGRALYALIGNGINEENIRHACEFVIGACSCQVKELNPGMDLLLAADWDSFIDHSLVGEWEMSLAMEGGSGETNVSETSGKVTTSSDKAEFIKTSSVSFGISQPFLIGGLVIGGLILINFVYAMYKLRS